MSSSDFLTLLLFFARTSGFFLISPLFAKKNIPLGVRFGFAALVSLVLIPPLSLNISWQIDSSLFLLTFAKEVAIGYLLGFLFSLIFEAAALGGQVVGTLAGFSITELLDPQSGIENSLFAKLFALTIFAFFLACDLHHYLIRFLFESFDFLPLFPDTFSIAKASSQLFEHALSFAFIPMVFLGFVLVSMAVIARALPELPIFFVGFPLQLLVGILATALALSFFADTLRETFFHWLDLCRHIFFAL